MPSSIFIYGKMPLRLATAQARSHGLSDGLQDAVELPLVDFKASFRPNDIIGEGHLFLDRPLGTDALLNVFGGPPTIQKPQALSGGGACGAYSGVKFFFSARFKQERNDY